MPPSRPAATVGCWFDDEGRSGHAACAGWSGRPPNTDAAALLAVPLRLEAGHAWHATVLLGHATSLNAARELAREAWKVDPLQRLAAQRAVWRGLSAAVQVATPDAAFDAPRQPLAAPRRVLACRIWGPRRIFPGRRRLRLSRPAAGRDVPGCSTRLSVWLRRSAATRAASSRRATCSTGGTSLAGLACARISPTTGYGWRWRWRSTPSAPATRRWPTSSCPSSKAAPVPDGAEDIYETPAITERHRQPLRACGAQHRHQPAGGRTRPAAVRHRGLERRYEPCRRRDGKGESVWMGFFLCAVIDALRPMAIARGEQARAEGWQRARDMLSGALSMRTPGTASGYRRGWFDDGSVLGTHTASECRIDLIVQAWAVLTGAARPERAAQALDSAWRELHDRDANLLRLPLAPIERSRARSRLHPSLPRRRARKTAASTTMPPPGP